MPALLEERAVIVLAAGASRRFTDGDKLLADFRGKPLVDAPLARAAELPSFQARRWRNAPVGRG